MFIYYRRLEERKEKNDKVSGLLCCNGLFFFIAGFPLDATIHKDEPGFCKLFLSWCKSIKMK